MKQRRGGMKPDQGQKHPDTELMKATGNGGKCAKVHRHIKRSTTTIHVNIPIER